MASAFAAKHHMCEWMASDLLEDWRLSLSHDLHGIGTIQTSTTDDGSMAVVEMKTPAFVASVTAWSTGMLELITLDTRGAPPYGDPDVVTEQRQLRSHAAALLDQWSVRLRDLLSMDGPLRAAEQQVVGRTSPSAVVE